MAAGLLSEKVGINEMPLLVTLAAAEKWPLFFGLSIACEKAVCVTLKKIKPGKMLLKKQPKIRGSNAVLNELKDSTVVFFIVLYVRYVRHTKEREVQILL